MKRLLNRIVLLFLLAIYFSFDLFGANIFSADSNGVCHSDATTYLVNRDYAPAFSTSIYTVNVWSTAKAPVAPMYPFIKPMINGTVQHGTYTTFAFYIPNTVVTCPTCSVGTKWDFTTQTCKPVDLQLFDNDPYGCIKNGGIPTGSVQNTGGLAFWKTGFSLKWVRKCNNKQGAIDETIPLIAGITGNISGKSDLLGILLDKGIKKVKGIWNDLLNSGTPISDDYLLGLPKYNPNTKTYEPVVKTNPIEKGADGVTPARAQTLEVDPYNQFLRDEYFPKNNLDPSGDPVVDMATADRFNKTNEIFKDNGTDPVTYTFTPNNANIWKSTKGVQTSEPVYDTIEMVASPSGVYSPKTTYETPTFRVAPSDLTFYPPVPVHFTDVPVQSTVSDTLVAGKPVKQWENTRHYSDGSASRETILIDETAKKGVRSTTVIASNSASSTTSETFDIPNYVPGSTDPANYDIGKNGPVITGTAPIKNGTTSGTPIIDPVTGYPTTTPDPFANTGSLPTTAEGQDIINAPMPSYNVPTVGDFVPFDSNPISEMITGSSELFSNISNQIASTKTVFDNTKLMLEGGWTPPVIPAGSCGDSMAFDFHGRHIDLCPPLVNSTAVASPIVSSVVTIGGMGFAVMIFIGGF